MNHKLNRKNNQICPRCKQPAMGPEIREDGQIIGWDCGECGWASWKTEEEMNKDGKES